MLPRPGHAAWGLAGFLCCFLPTLADAAQEATNTTVNVQRNGQVFEIQSVSRVLAGADVAWTVLTDYEGYVNFVPGMTQSRRLDGQPIRIEQRGEFGVLFIRMAVNVTLEVVEDPLSEIRFRALEGNVRSLNTTVKLRSDGAHVVVIYQSVIEPDFWVPPLIGTPLMRAAIRRKLEAVANEIERRATDMKAGQ